MTKAVILDFWHCLIRFLKYGLFIQNCVTQFTESAPHALKEIEFLEINIYVNL